MTSGCLLILGAYLGAAIPVVAAPTLAVGRDLGPGLKELEASVSWAPGDVDALEALVVAYLEREAPGVAQAALDRAPASVQGLARVADLRARSLADLGLVGPALASQERALDACAKEICSNAMLARGERRVRWLRELVRLKVDDRLLDSAAASGSPAEGRLPLNWEFAYRSAVREVRLAVP